MHSPPLSTTSPTPPDLETVFEALNLFIAKERQALCTEIEKLTEENKSLVKENRKLLSQTVRSRSPSSQPPEDPRLNPEFTSSYSSNSTNPQQSEQPDLVSILLEKVHHYQRFLLKERELHAHREQDFQRNLRSFSTTIREATREDVSIRSEASSLRHGGNRWSTVSSSSTMSSQSPRIGQTVTPKTSPQLVQRGFGSSAAQGKPLPQKPLPRTPTTLASPPESPRKNRKDGYTPASIAHTEEESEGEEEEAEEEQESLTNSEESSTNCEDSDSTEQDPLNRTNSSQQATSAIPQPTHTLKNSGNQVVNRVMVLTAALSKRTEEIRMIRQLAEQKVQETMERIKELELRAEGVEVLKSHTHNANLELDVLKLKLKKLETMAFEFVPLSEQHLLLDFEEYKEQLLKAQTKQKQRRKKEDERWKLWGERVVDGKGVVRDSERHGGWKGN